MIDFRSSGVVRTLVVSPLAVIATAMAVATGTLAVADDTPGHTGTATSGAPGTTILSPTTEEWQPIFNGKNFGFWRNYGAKSSAVENWTIEDGVLGLRPRRWGLLAMIRSALFGGNTGDLVYTGSRFHNFELSLEWKISHGGNSGVFYLVDGERYNAPWQSGLEMQILDNENHPDGTNKRRRAGSLYDIAGTETDTASPLGEWNRALIRVDNNLIEHWLNGHKTVSIRRFSPEWDQWIESSKFSGEEGSGTSDDGYIVLQDHGDAVWFRNIKLKEL